MCAIAIEVLTPLNRTSPIKVYNNNTRPRLFFRITKKAYCMNRTNGQPFSHLGQVRENFQN